MTTNPKNKGYTTTEAAIVIVVLVSIAYFIVPQFGQAAIDSRQKTLDEFIIKVNTRIDIFQLDHDRRLPGTTKASWLAAMTSCTDKFGNVYDDKCSRLELEKCGPYIDKIIPNPFNDLSTVRINGPAAGANTHGYRYDTATGLFESDYHVKK